jgi:predicted nuclease of predicted toxin-antitoxin system
MDRIAIASKRVRYAPLRDAPDEEIFLAARKAGAHIMTKDSDFVRIPDRLGPPPTIIWLTCGNTSVAAMINIFTARLGAPLALCEAGEPLIEIS